MAMRIMQGQPTSPLRRNFTRQEKRSSRFFAVFKTAGVCGRTRPARQLDPALVCSRYRISHEGVAGVLKKAARQRWALPADNEGGAAGSVSTADL